MNDPRSTALHNWVEHDVCVDYDNAALTDYEDDLLEVPLGKNTAHSAAKGTLRECAGSQGISRGVHQNTTKKGLEALITNSWDLTTDDVSRFLDREMDA